MKGWVGLGWLVTFWNKVPPPGVEPGHVTHPSTNRARRRVTSLIRPTLLPLRHAANLRLPPGWCHIKFFQPCKISPCYAAFCPDSFTACSLVIWHCWLGTVLTCRYLCGPLLICSDHSVGQINNNWVIFIVLVIMVMVMVMVNVDLYSASLQKSLMRWLSLPWVGGGDTSSQKRSTVVSGEWINRLPCVYLCALWVCDLCF